MDKKQTVAYLAQDKSEQMLLLRLCERLDSAIRRNIMGCTCFLCAREQMLLAQLYPETPLVFFGGCDGAERKMCFYLPDYLDEGELSGEDSPLAAVRAQYYEKDTLTHRDLLGALMGLGIKRETVGDIYVGSGSSDFLLTREILPYVLQNLTSAGRSALHLHPIALAQLQVPQQNVKTVRDTVSSLRLDSIISSGFQLSRTKAAEYIAAQKAELNHALCQKADKAVAAGDVISVRGLGKLRLESVDGTTRKGRLGITVSRYL